MEVECQEILKNNDIVLHGVMIRKLNESVYPTIYIEDYLEKGNGVDEIARNIVSTYESVTKDKYEFGDITGLINNFDEVKQLLRIRLINKENNAKLFQNIPYMPFLDMAIITVIQLNHTSDGVATIKVTNDLLRLWNTDLSSVLSIANKNTFATPYSYTSMAEALGLPEYMMDSLPIKMYVLTNATTCHGATEICNYKTMEEIADKLQSDLIVLPSSIHEVIIVPKDDNMDINELTNMVQAINGSEVAADEVLSDHAYVFNRDNGWER